MSVPQETRWTAMRAGDWLANVPRTLEGYWPRRAVRLVAGPALPHSLNHEGLIGIYLAEDLHAPPIFYPLCSSPALYVAALARVEQDERTRLRLQIAYQLWQATQARVTFWKHSREVEQLLDQACKRPEKLELQELDTLLDGLAVAYPSEGEDDKPEAYLQDAESLLVAHYDLPQLCREIHTPSEKP